MIGLVGEDRGKLTLGGRGVGADPVEMGRERRGPESAPVLTPQPPFGEPADPLCLDPRMCPTVHLVGDPLPGPPLPVGTVCEIPPECHAPTLVVPGSGEVDRTDNSPPLPLIDGPTTLAVQIGWPYAQRGERCMMNGSLVRDVVIGLDGSSQALVALRWAVDSATPGGTVHAVHVMLPVEELAFDAVLGDSVALRRRREETLRDEWIGPVLEFAERRDVKVDATVSEGTVAETLMSLADEVDADAIVVGHHPATRLGPQLVGHVTAELLHDSDRPVIVVPDDWEPVDGVDDRPVAVGVGVAPATRAAIRWALERRGDTAVSLVHALGPRSLFRPSGVLDVLAYHLDPSVIPGWVEDDLTALAEEVRAEAGVDDDVDVTVEVARGRTGPVLVRAGERARLLVLGRGEPPFVREHVIAPYLRHALTHAVCPVVVVPVCSSG